MVKLSNGQEVSLVGIGAACGGVATYAGTQPIPENLKVPIVSIFGGIAAFIGAYWAIKVQAKPETPSA